MRALPLFLLLAVGVSAQYFAPPTDVQQAQVEQSRHELQGFIEVHRQLHPENHWNPRDGSDLFDESVNNGMDPDASKEMVEEMVADDMNGDDARHAMRAASQDAGQARRQGQMSPAETEPRNLGQWVKQQTHNGVHGTALADAIHQRMRERNQASGSTSSNSNFPRGFSEGEKRGWKGADHPPGWSHGERRGWDGGSQPPGWSHRRQRGDGTQDNDSDSDLEATEDRDQDDRNAMEDRDRDRDDRNGSQRNDMDNNGQTEREPRGFDQGQKRGFEGQEQPPGWSHGERNGWGGGNQPPGWSNGGGMGGPHGGGFGGPPGGGFGGGHGGGHGHR